MTPDTLSFIDGTYRLCQGEYVFLGDDTPIEIKGKGSIRVGIPPHTMKYDDVLHVPGLSHALWFR